MNHLPPSTLIATLGSEAQVVTATLELLLEQGEPINQARVIHTHAPGTPLAQAVNRLRAAFDAPPYPPGLDLRLVPLRDSQGRLLEDVITPSDAQAAFRILYEQVRQVKQLGRKLHLSIAGERKPMALFGMACAQLLCDESDRLWYLYSGGEFLSSKRLHPKPGDQVHLIEVPFIRWSRVSPIWTSLGTVEDPLEAARRIEHHQLADRLEAARAFVLGSLTPAEQRVVSLLVREGLSDSEMAARLGLSPRTVEQHLRIAYQKAAAHWDLENVSRAQLVVLLNLYHALS